jgi:hypothetical protein
MYTRQVVCLLYALLFNVIVLYPTLNNIIYYTKIINAPTTTLIIQHAIIQTKYKSSTV